MESAERMTTLEVRRDDPAVARLLEEPLPEPADGEALLRVERFGLSANNITYAALGDQLGYWRFFPTVEGWGRIPAWGFATVVAGHAAALPLGARVFGYVPMATHLVLRPEGGKGGIVDTSPHRADLPKAYNTYLDPATDRAHAVAPEDAVMLLRPLFSLSFLLDDALGEHDATLLVTSASSKTSLGLARLQADRGVPVVGLTSERHRTFVEGIGVYEQVVSYNALETLPVPPAATLVDVAGSAAVRRVVHERLGGALARSILVGATHRDAAALADTAPLPGPAPAFFFAPDQLRARIREWGPAGFDARFAEAFAVLVGWSEEWLERRPVEGPAAALAAYREVAAGAAPPDAGYVVKLR
jgi:hypothetical protein